MRFLAVLSITLVYFSLSHRAAYSADAFTSGASTSSGPQTNSNKTKSAATPIQGLGSSSSSDKQFDEQMNLVERHISLFRVTDSDFETLEKIITARPKDSYARYLLGRCFERRGLVDMAVEQFSIAEKLETKPEDILRRLKHHIEAGELSEAFNMRNFANSKAPNDPTIELLQGLTFQEQGAASSAEFIYNKLLKMPNCPFGTATALASLRLDEKKWNEAIDLADRDLKVNSQYVSGLIVKSQALLALGQSSRVIANLLLPLKEHPFNRRLNLLMYKAYRHEGKFEEAFSCALRNLAGSDYTTYFEDAKNRVKEMLRALSSAKAEKVVERESTEVDRTNYAMKFHFYLGWCYLDLRKAKEAERETQKALDLAPEFEPNWYQMGRIKEELRGDLPAAAACFKKGHQLQRSDYKCLRALKRVNARVKNMNRDLSLKIKNLSRHTQAQ